MCGARLSSARSDARGSRAGRGTALERDGGLRGFGGGLQTELLCLKMSDCFVPRCLLRRFTATSLKCNLNSSTLPLLKGCRNETSDIQGFRLTEEENLPAVYLEREENRLVRRAAICMFPLDLFFPLQHPELQLEMEQNK